MASDYKNLLDLLRAAGGKLIIVEGGRPQAVLLGYEEFERLILARPAVGQLAGPQNGARSESDLIQAVNRVISGIRSSTEEINRQITAAQLLENTDPNEGKEPEDEVRIEPLD